jgi:RNA polymerase sigma factor (sigma-70 family)
MAKHSSHPLLHYLRRLSGGKGGDGALDDAQLLHRFLTERDESAFTTLVQRYGAMVWGLCVRRLGETPEAEDAFQATFLVLVRKATSLRSAELLGPWLYGVAARTALKLRGQKSRRAARETPLPEQLAEQRPEQPESDLRPILDEEINRLPQKYRLPVLLCYLQGLSSEEAAQRLGCAKGTIFSRLSRARDLLRRRLLRRGVDVSAGALAVVLAENATLRAAVPAALCEMTIRTSVLFAAGTAGQALSAPLAALVEGVVRSMFFSKMKFVAIVVLALGLVGSGVGFVAHRGDAEQPEKKLVAKPAAASVGKTKPKAAPAEGHQPPRPVVEENKRLHDWHDKLLQPISFPGLDDSKSTLTDILVGLERRYNLQFIINEKSFAEAGLLESGEILIAQRPIPDMKVRLATILQFILNRINANSQVVFLVRKDHIEITTEDFVRKELGSIPRFDNNRPVPPLIWDAFEEAPLAKILPRLAETSGYNVVTDPKVGEKLQTKLSAQLINVPVDTAVRLVANMAGLTVVRLDNVFYVTTAENAKQLREEQAKLKADEMLGGMAGPKPASDKAAK